MLLIWSLVIHYAFSVILKLKYFGMLNNADDVSLFSLLPITPHLWLGIVQNMLVSKTQKAHLIARMGKRDGKENVCEVLWSAMVEYGRHHYRKSDLTTVAETWLIKFYVMWNTLVSFIFCIKVLKELENNSECRFVIFLLHSGGKKSQAGSILIHGILNVNQESSSSVLSLML